MFVYEYVYMSVYVKVRKVWTFLFNVTEWVWSRQGWKNVVNHRNKTDKVSEMKTFSFVDASRPRVYSGEHY